MTDANFQIFLKIPLALMVELVEIVVAKPKQNKKNITIIIVVVVVVVVKFLWH